MENKSKLNESKFSNLFGDWWPKIKPFFYEGKFDPIYKELKNLSARGKRIFPSSEQTFRAFQECSIENVRLIILAMCPYHSLSNGVVIADGLCLSCGNTKYPQPSLEYFWRALENELYNDLCLPCNRNPDLSYLSNREGVLLLNAGLTVEMGKAGSHNSLWMPFMEYLFTNAFDTLGVPVLLLGNEAQKVEKYISPFTQVFRLSHPASAAYKNEDRWETGTTFREIQKILEYKHGKGINWFDEEDRIPF